MPTAEKVNSAQQETNNALAALAKAGNTFALGQLWELNKGLIRRVYWQWYPSHRATADAAGLTVDDFEQEGYFAVKQAAEGYDPELGAFSTHLCNTMKYHIGDVLKGEHARNIIGRDGKLHTISANPLNRCKSLDEPLQDADGEEAAALVDFIPDHAAKAAFDSVEATVYNEQLHEMLETELDRLPERDAAIIRLHYYEGLTLQAAGETLGVSTERARRLEVHGMRKLRTSKAVRLWRISLQEQRDCLAWRHSGLGAWENSGSVQERAVEALERKGAYTITGGPTVEDLLELQQAEHDALFERMAEKEKELDETLSKALGMTQEEFAAYNVRIKESAARSRNN